MRLLIINQFASTPKYSTGAGERFYYLAEEFQKYGMETTVVSAAFNHLFLNLPDNSKLFNKEETKFATFYWVKLRKYKAENKLGRIIAFFEFLVKLFLFPIKKKDKPDLVIVSSMSIFPVFYARFLKWKYKIPFILEIRDIWPLTPIELGGFSSKHPFIKLLEFTANYGYKHADQIVSVLPGFDSFLAKKGFETKPFNWIPNGINPRLQVESKSDEKSKKFIVCYAGAIGTANSLEFLIEAAKLLDNQLLIEFWIVGDGPEKDKLINSSNGKENIQFFNKVPKDEVQKILAQADCCFIGWRKRKIYEYGVSANKYNDYMLAKKPILSSSNISNDPVIMANCGIRVESENSRAIANGIVEIMNTSNQQKKEWGENGNQFVKENHSYLALSKKYLFLIRTLIPESEVLESS